MPAFAELADRAGDEPRQIAHDEARVLARDLDLAGKREVIAHEHGRADDEPGREALVVRVAQAEDVGVIALLLVVGDLEQAEVASPIGAHAVGLGDNPHVGAGECAGHFRDERLVGDRAPGAITLRGDDAGELRAFHFGRAAMQDQVALVHV